MENLKPSFNESNWRLLKETSTKSAIMTEYRLATKSCESQKSFQKCLIYFVYTIVANRRTTRFFMLSKSFIFSEKKRSSMILSISLNQIDWSYNFFFLQKKQNFPQAYTQLHLLTCLRINSKYLPLLVKGQIISKANFQAQGFFQKNERKHIAY